VKSIVCESTFSMHKWNEKRERDGKIRFGLLIRKRAYTALGKYVFWVDSDGINAERIHADVFKILPYLKQRIFFTVHGEA
jgi:hypothetical protein